MLKNYFKTTVRSLLRTKTNSIINVLGLALGIACSIVLFLLASYNESFDTFHHNYDRIYRLVNHSISQGGTIDYTPGVPIPLPDALREDFPEFEEVVLISDYYQDKMFTINAESERPQYFELKDNRLAFTENGYFKLFDTNWISGNMNTALDGPGKVVLSESMANLFFKEGNALGQVIVFNMEWELQVTGVMANPRKNSDMPFEILISAKTNKEKFESDRWNSISSNDQCYILLTAQDKGSNYGERFFQFDKKHFGEDNDNPKTFDLQPMSDLHFNEQLENFNYRTVTKSEVMIMILIGIFLIITACINFVNLSTAVAVRRSKEVGVRKAFGSTKGQLIFQFLLESFAIILISVVIGLGIAEFIILNLNPFLETDVNLNLFDPLFFGLLVIGTLLVTILAGFYPALILSRYTPALALKSRSTRYGGKFSLRQGLVVFQFFISQLFIIGTIIILGQMNFIKNTDLGFNSDALINIRIPEKNTGKLATLKTELSRIAGVEGITLTFSNPSSGSVATSNFSVENSSDKYYTAMKVADNDYLGVYDIDLLAGSNLQLSDTLKEIIVNENFLKYMGFDGSYQDAIGMQIEFYGYKVPIAGVMADFHSVSLKEEIMPIALFSDIKAYKLATLKVNMTDFARVNDQIKSVWKSLYPAYDYDYKFVDEEIEDFYEAEADMVVIVTFFSGVAILIGCLGLFGLASFLVNQKVKEIGVRKALGASVMSIFGMFSFSFLRLIVISFLMAAPLGWLIMNQWLQDFQFRISIGPIFFITGLGATLLIALFTVGYKSISAALANPIDCLRDE